MVRAELAMSSAEAERFPGDADAAPHQVPATVTSHHRVHRRNSAGRQAAADRFGR